MFFTIVDINEFLKHMHALIIKLPPFPKTYHHDNIMRYKVIVVHKTNHTAL